MANTGAEESGGARRFDAPLSVDVITDFLAGDLEPHDAERVRSVIVNDPAAQRIVAALDSTDADLSSLRDEEIPIPSDVRQRMLDVISRFHTD